MFRVSTGDARTYYRGKEVLRLIVAEHTNTTQEIADKLFISFRTAENHRYSILQKLDVKNTAGLVKIAMQMGLLEQRQQPAA
ncbi:response regulator transcription factor [Chitinophagaceae bacterium MMS25-I14]